MPEIKAASAIDGFPFTNGGFDNTFTVDGRPAIPGKPLQADIRRVDPGYFSTMAIPIVEGRALNDADRADSPPVVIVSAGMARKYWPGESAIGKRLTVLFGPPAGIHAEIVGVAADVRSALDAEPNDFIYLPYPQGFHIAQMDLALRPRERAASVAALARAAKDVIRKIDPDQPVYRVRGAGELVSSSLAARNFEMVLLGIFAVLAVTLASVGLYGVLAYSVQARTKEIGIRMALGATQGRVSGMVLRHALKLTGAGLAIGVVCARALTGVLAGLLFGVRATDAPTFVAVSLALLCAAGFAGYIPARRAARVDPMVALRDE
jgi:putative ABC transport system permease protein